jgi:hypothetical protein
MKFDDYYNMSEQEQMKFEHEFIHQAFLNSYLLLTDQKSINKIIKSGQGVAHNFAVNDINEINGVISYFAELEDYTKCIEIRDRDLKKKSTTIKNKKKTNPKKNIIKFF